MAKLRHNVVANFIGQGWIALIGVLLAPVYIRMLGMEGYGLIGVYLSLQGLLFVLDLGLSAALTRELARHARTSSDPQFARDIARTLELIFLPLCLAVAFLAVAASPSIATNWLHPVDFGEQRVASALTLMGIATALQWPSAFYSGGLSGLERQVLLNSASVVFATLRWAAVIPVMQLASSSIEVFLYWQIGVAAAQSVTMRLLLSRSLPRATRSARFNPDIVRSIRGFSLGLFGIAVLSFLLVQIDRIALSHALPLDSFGQYVLAATATATLSRALYPFFSALYPRYSGLVAAGERAQLDALYHTSNGHLASLGGAAAAMACPFAEEILVLWTTDETLAAATAPVLTVLAAGALLNGLMSLPYALQLAHGWTRITLWVNAVSLLALVPATFWMARQYGMIGAASCWLMLNLFNFVVVMPFVHRRLMPNATLRWYLQDVLPPVLAAFTTTWMVRAMLSTPLRGISGILTLLGVFAVALAAAHIASVASRRFATLRLARAASTLRTR